MAGVNNEAQGIYNPNFGLLCSYNHFIHKINTFLFHTPTQAPTCPIHHDEIFFLIKRLEYIIAVNIYIYYRAMHYKKRTSIQESPNKDKKEY